MIQTQVFSVWTSTLFSEEPERELQRESIKLENSENSKESLPMKLSNGSLKSALELLYEQQ
jgi:hypothetical protein